MKHIKLFENKSNLQFTKLENNQSLNSFLRSNSIILNTIDGKSYKLFNNLNHLYDIESNLTNYFKEVNNFEIGIYTFNVMVDNDYHDDIPYIEFIINYDVNIQIISLEDDYYLISIDMDNMDEMDDFIILDGSNELMIIMNYILDYYLKSEKLLRNNRRYIEHESLISYLKNKFS